MNKCDFKGCNKEATTLGYVYGHVKDSNDPDSFIDVMACDEHAEREDFFELSEDDKI